jgi:RNA polymerase sigma-70 factor (ECF subfamily)
MTTLTHDPGVGWHHGAIVPPSTDPRLLMERVQAGDQDAFAALYDLLASVVHGAVLRVVRDPAMSEEVTQEVFVELWRTAGRFDADRAAVSTWAVTIARRRAIDRVRREQSQRDRLERAAQQPVGDAHDAADAAVSALEADRVGQAIAELPDDQRVVIEMAFLDGDTHAEIADRLGVPLGTVKGRVRGGLKKLGARLGVDHGQ